jgi:hypothetical protein
MDPRVGSRGAILPLMGFCIVGLALLAFGVAQVGHQLGRYKRLRDTADNAAAAALYIARERGVRNSDDGDPDGQFNAEFVTRTDKVVSIMYPERVGAVVPQIKTRAVHDGPNYFDPLTFDIALKDPTSNQMLSSGGIDENASTTATVRGAMNQYVFTNSSQVKQPYLLFVLDYSAILASALRLDPDGAPAVVQLRNNLENGFMNPAGSPVAELAVLPFNSETKPSGSNAPSWMPAQPYGVGGTFGYMPTMEYPDIRAFLDAEAAQEETCLHQAMQRAKDLLDAVPDNTRPRYLFLLGSGMPSPCDSDVKPLQVAQTTALAESMWAENITIYVLQLVVVPYTVYSGPGDPPPPTDADRDNFYHSLAGSHDVNATTAPWLTHQDTEATAVSGAPAFPYHLKASTSGQFADAVLQLAKNLSCTLKPDNDISHFNPADDTSLRGYWRYPKSAGNVLISQGPVREQTLLRIFGDGGGQNADISCRNYGQATETPGCQPGIAYDRISRKVSLTNAACSELFATTPATLVVRYDTPWPTLDPPNFVGVATN